MFLHTAEVKPRNLTSMRDVDGPTSESSKPSDKLVPSGVYPIARSIVIDAI
jgi:hypothetical protein